MSLILLEMAVYIDISQENQERVFCERKPFRADTQLRDRFLSWLI